MNIKHLVIISRITTIKKYCGQLFWKHALIYSEILAAWHEEQLLRRSTKLCSLEKFVQFKEPQETS